jgi:hypothetical protein
MASGVIVQTDSFKPAIRDATTASRIERNAPAPIDAASGTDRSPSPRFDSGASSPPPSASSSLPAEPVAMPVGDLVFTGLGGFPTKRQAYFMITSPEQGPGYFSLREGERNDLLEIRSINFETGEVTAIMKKPVMRIQSVNEEVVLSFRFHGNHGSP